MLRISADDDARVLSFRLEGRLEGPHQQPRDRLPLRSMGARERIPPPLRRPADSVAASRAVVIPEHILMLHTSRKVPR
jgi:hypothetical protein